MSVPVQVTFQHLWPSDEVMEIVRQNAESLQAAYGAIHGCHVTIDRPRRGKGKGRKYRVSVDITTGDSNPSAKASSEHSRLKAALSRAFHTIGPRLGIAVKAAA